MIQLQRKKHMTLVTIFILFSILSFMGVTMMNMSTTERQVAQNYESREMSRQNAEKGLQMALLTLNDNPFLDLPYEKTEPGDYIGFEYKFIIETTEVSTVLQVISTGNFSYNPQDTEIDAVWTVDAEVQIEGTTNIPERVLRSKAIFDHLN